MGVTNRCRRSRWNQHHHRHRYIVVVIVIIANINIIISSGSGSGVIVVVLIIVIIFTSPPSTHADSKWKRVFNNQRLVPCDAVGDLHLKIVQLHCRSIDTWDGHALRAWLLVG